MTPLLSLADVVPVGWASVRGTLRTAGQDVSDASRGPAATTRSQGACQKKSRLGMVRKGQSA